MDCLILDGIAAAIPERASEIQLFHVVSHAVMCFGGEKAVNGL
jgi:hypothetical protein